jgi:hypothetical protein
MRRAAKARKSCAKKGGVFAVFLHTLIRLTNRAPNRGMYVQYCTCVTAIEFKFRPCSRSVGGVLVTPPQEVADGAALKAPGCAHLVV